jgi:hypothetical protein
MLILNRNVISLFQAEDDNECRIYIASSVKAKELEDDTGSVIFPNAVGNIVVLFFFY